jgi:uncharacterized membrane protein
MAKTSAQKKKGITLKQTLPYIFLIAGIIGCIASFALTYDKIQVIQNPNYRPSCNINPILSCGSVMKTQQASLLGVPNTIFGLMGFSALSTLGVALLAGASFRRWLWRTINVGLLAAFGFFIYLFFEGVYRINALCPYCFVVWMIVPPLLWYTTLYNIAEGHLKLRFINANLTKFLQRRHGDVLLVWYLFIFTLLLTHFWYYWKTVL